MEFLSIENDPELQVDFLLGMKNVGLRHIKEEILFDFFECYTADAFKSWKSNNNAVSKFQCVLVNSLKHK